MSEGRHDHAPGRPLWRAAERERVAKGMSKPDWVLHIGIGRVTYDRISTQANPPQGRTVKKIAAALGITINEAMQLAGHDGRPVLLAPDGSLSMEYPATEKRINTSRARKEIQTLRELAEKSRQTLGDVLVITGLAEPEELKVTKDQVVEEIENDDLPDDVKQEFLDGYRQLREQVAETARRRRGSN